MLQAAPIKVFLSFMSVEGSMEGLRRAVRGVRMLQQIDDHTDVIHFTLPQPLVRDLQDRSERRADLAWRLSPRGFLHTD